MRSLSDEVLLVPNNEHLIRVGAISSIASSMAIGDVLYLGSIQDDLDTEIERNMIETSQLVSRLKRSRVCKQMNLEGLTTEARNEATKRLTKCQH